MNRKWLATLMMALGLKLSVFGAPVSAGPFQFVEVSTNDVKYFNTNLYPYYGVTTSGTNFVCVGAGSTASFGSTNPPVPGGYLTNHAAWADQNITNGSYILNTVTYGAGVFLAAGTNNSTFVYGSKWSGPVSSVPGSSVNAEGVAYSSGSNTFSLVTASYLAAWAPQNGTNWSSAPDNTNSASIVESFRGVTSFGGNRFALCGIRGDVRLSQDGGHSWNVNREFNFEQPDLNAIASDGSNSLVAVGVSGTVLVSTNAGAGWVTNTIPGHTNDTFYAVTYTGTNDNQFFVMGAGGDVFSAVNNRGTNNWTWATNYAIGTTANLRSAVAATSGPLAGTMAAVGDTGTILIGGTPPAPAISLGDQTNCASYPAAPSNPPLVVQVLPDVDHPAGSVTVDWFDAHMVPLTNSALYAIYTNNGAGLFTNITQDAQAFSPDTASNYVYYARVRDLRTGFTNTPTKITLVLNPRPMASLLSFNSTNCNEGPVYTLTNTLTGLGPWTVIWNDGYAQTTNAALGSSAILLRTVNPTNSFGVDAASNNVFYVTSISNADMCLGNEVGDIIGAVTNTIDPRPTASLLSFNTTNCNEGPVYTLTNTLTGLGPWMVLWNDGYVQITNAALGTSAILLRTVNPTNSFAADVASNNVFYVVGISNADTCVGNLPGDLTGFVTNTINPRPTATLLPFISTDCNEGPVYTLTNTLTGVGPWTVLWNDGYSETTNAPAGSSVILVRTVNPTNGFAADIASNNVFYVTSVVDMNSCIGNLPGDITGMVTNIVNPRPTASLLSFNTTNCNEGPIYTLTNTLTGYGPWTIYWNDGFIQTNLLVTNGTVFFTRTVYPTNSFGVDTASNNVFYVTNVVDGTGCVANQAGDITGFVTNTINPRPTATLWSFNTTDCNEGPVYTLTNTLTGFGPWTVLWNDGYSQTTNATAGSSVILVRTVYPTNSFAADVASNNVYYVTNVVDANSCIGNLPGDITGEVTNTVNPRPTASLLSFNTTNCNEGPVYTLTNTLTGYGPWTVTWNDGYTQTTNAVAGSSVILIRTVYPTNSFGVDTASNNVFYVTNVVDGTSCVGNQAGDITGSVTNTINPRPTAMLWSFDTTDCNEGPVYTLTNTLTGFGPWTVMWNDGYTQTTNAPLGSSVTLIRTVYPTNSFAVDVASNNVYYVTNVVDANSCIGNLPGDITGVVTNTVNPRPTASLLSFNTTNCNEGPVYTLTNTLTGVGPWTVLWNDGYLQTTNAPVGSSVTMIRTVYPANSFGVNTASNNVFYLTYVADGTGCVGDQAGDITGVVTNTINPRPTAMLWSFATTDCNEGPVYTLTNTLTGFGPWTVMWNDGYTQTTNATAGSSVILVRTVYPTNSFAADVASNNVYYVTNVVDANSCIGNLPGDITGEVTNTVNPRPTASLWSFVSTNCNDGTSYTLTNTLTGYGPWTVMWNDGYAQTTNAAVGSSVILVRTVYPTNTFAVASNSVYYVTNVVDGTSCVGNEAGDITGMVTNIVDPSVLSPIVSLSLPGLGTNSAGDFFETNVLGNTLQLSVQAALQGTADNWYDATGINAETNDTSTYLPTNQVCGEYTNYVQAEDTTTGCLSPLVRVVLVLVPPAPDSTGDQTNCAGESNPPLTVTTTKLIEGTAVNWFYDSTATNPVPGGAFTLSITPTNTLAGTYTYYAQTVANNFASTNTTPVSLVLQNCTNTPTLYSLGSPATNVVVTWFGNLSLESTTNLTPPINWTIDAVGVAGATNSWTNAITLPLDFFRLYAPTN